MVSVGTRIALLVQPGIDLTVILYGLWRRGAIAVVVDAGLGLRGIRTALRSAGPKYVIGGFKGLGGRAHDGVGGAVHQRGRRPA